MQRQEQLTADAAFKFALWKALREQCPLSEPQAQGDPTVEQAIAAHVQRVALPAIQRALPRRVVQPCCMSGTCVPRGPLFTHAALHPGRAEIRLTHPVAVRDEACWCAAHFAAAGVPQPAALHVQRYRATEADTRLPHQGLRCLLKHVRLRHVEFTDVPRWQDAQAVVAEVASLMLRQGRVSAPHGTAPEAMSVVLRRVPTPGLAMARFLRLTAAVDCLTTLTLESGGMGELHTLAAYVHTTRVLQRLDVAGNDHLALTDWVQLGEAVARSASLSFLGLSGCGWGPAHLEAFLDALRDFRPRPGGLALDLSRQRGLSVEYTLHAMAALTPRTAQPHITGALLDGLEASSPGAAAALAQLTTAAPETAGGAAVGLFFARLGQLTRLSIAAPEGGGLESAVCQRVMRGICDRAGPSSWESLNLTGQLLSQGQLKRLLQRDLFAPGAELCLRHVPLGETLGKLPSLGACLQPLRSLTLASCQLSDAALTQMASAMERSAPLALQHLNLDDNPFEKALPFLCKALRAHCAPHLRELHLSATRLTVRPMLTLLEQISSTLHALFTNATAFADNTSDRTLALTTIVRRQRGDVALRFGLLDWWCAAPAGKDSADEPDTNSRELQDWLQRQTEVRLLRDRVE